jgi:hypothetical protein
VKYSRGEEGSMADETPDIPVEERVTYGTDAHADDPDEDPEEHIGDEIPDPWEDPEQRDWATTTPDLGEEVA